MPIELDTGSDGGNRSPILKNQRIGETALAMLIDTPEIREQIKDGQKVPHATKPGQFRKEMVLHLLVLPGTTMEAKLKGEGGVPAEGDIVRRIVKGKEWSQWIDALDALPAHPSGAPGAGRNAVGDVVAFTTTHGQVYDQDGRPMGESLTDQAACDAVPRGRSLGMYGDVLLRRANPDEATWVTKAEDAYHQRQKGIALGDDGQNPEAHAAFAGAAADTSKPAGF